MKKIYLSVDSTNQRFKKKNLKFSDRRFFLFALVHFELQISQRIFEEKKIETGLIGYSEAWGKLTHEKTLN
jgi:hypothetical protein